METICLSYLPNEILSQITSYLHGSLIRLWRCGDKRLNYCLSIGGGISEVVFTDNATLSISRYPRFLDHLVLLTSLTISRRNSLICGPSALWNHLSKLTQLQNLDIACVEAEEWLLNEENDDLAKYPLLRDSHGTPSAEMELLRLKPFASTFPHLRSLDLTTKKPFLVDTDLRHFPSSLTRIHLWGNVQITPKSYKYFPGNNLQSIVTAVLHKLDEKTLNELPHSLTSIFRDEWLDLELTRPCSLLNLEDLTSLISHSSLPFLPKSLTRLRLRCTNMALPPISQLSLPCLRDLIIDGMSFQYLEETWYLPPSLTRLRISSNVSCDPDLQSPFAPMPISLKTLDLRLSEGMPWEKIKPSLAPGITQLCIRSGKGSVGPQILAELSPTMQSFTLDVIALYGQETVCQKPQVLNEYLEKYPLPSSLRHLHIFQSGSINASNLALLPRSLQSLSIQLHGSLNQDTFASFPPHLSSLVLHWWVHDDTTTTTTTIIIIIISAHDISLFPRSLEELRLSGTPSIIDWKSEEILALPQNLKTLSFQASTIEDQVIKLLPRYLTELIISGADAITSKSWIDLPRELVHLSLTPTSNAHDEDVKYLPRWIRTILINNAPLTIRCLSDLPPSLERIAVNPEVEKALKAESDREKNMAFNVFDPRIWTNSPSLHNYRY